MPRIFAYIFVSNSPNPSQAFRFRFRERERDVWVWSKQQQRIEILLLISVFNIFPSFKYWCKTEWNKQTNKKEENNNNSNNNHFVRAMEWNEIDWIYEIKETKVYEASYSSFFFRLLRKRTEFQGEEEEEEEGQPNIKTYVDGVLLFFVLWF